MKNWIPCFKVCAIVMFALVFIFGCKKTEVTYSAETEASQIKNWLDSNVKSNKNIDTTSTGLFFIVGKKGAGPTVVAGDTVTVKYSGMFLSGTVFDSSNSFTYVHKAANSRMIQGWEEAIEVMNKGEIADFLVPSAKAYGVNGYSSIPPFTPLLFTMEIVEIKIGL